MESPNFSEIAARVAAGSADVRACLLLSSDGLTLAAYPEDREPSARAAYGRMVDGDPEPERGFLAVGEEIWAFARRGGYGALAIGGRGVRPGVLLDALDGALKEAHQERVEAAPEPRPARRPSEPVRRTRTAPHSDPARRAERRPARPPARAPTPPVREIDPEEVIELETEVTASPAEAEDAPPARKPAPRPGPARAPAPAPPKAPARSVERIDVALDTVELTREFGGLFDGGER